MLYSKVFHLDGTSLLLFFFTQETNIPLITKGCLVNDEGNRHIIDKWVGEEVELDVVKTLILLSEDIYYNLKSNTIVKLKLNNKFTHLVRDILYHE